MTPDRPAAPAPPQEPIVDDDAALAADLAAAIAEPESAHREVFSRIGRNIGWLVGGRGFSGVASFFYLAFAARGMGPERFGVFALILSYAQGIANLVQFQCWQGVIRYGAVHLAEERRDRLARLIGFTGTLDVLTAIGGAIVAAIGVHVAAPLLGWTAEQRHLAALFGAVLLLSTGSTPSGILRLFNRFDIITFCEAVAPSVRLIGALVGWATGGGVATFLIVWGAAAILQSIVQWIAALSVEGGRLELGRSAAASAVAENRRLWRFLLQTNFAASLSMLWSQLGVLAVGAVAGPAAAGGFRLALKLARGIAKPVQTLTGVLYPEMARLVASEDHRTVAKVMRQIGLVSALLALLVAAIAGLGGPLILQAFAGSAYEFAHLYLFLLAIASALDLSGVAFEPLLAAHGRSGKLLGTRAIGAVLYIAALALLLPLIGAVGAAIAAILSSLAMRIRLGLIAARLQAQSAGAIAAT